MKIFLLLIGFIMSIPLLASSNVILDVAKIDHGDNKSLQRGAQERRDAGIPSSPRPTRAV